MQNIRNQLPIEFIVIVKVTFYSWHHWAWCSSCFQFACPPTDLARAYIMDNKNCSCFLSSSASCFSHFPSCSTLALPTNELLGQLNQQCPPHWEDFHCIEVKNVKSLIWMITTFFLNLLNQIFDAKHFCYYSSRNWFLQRSSKFVAIIMRGFPVWFLSTLLG